MVLVYFDKKSRVLSAAFTNSLEWDKIVKLFFFVVVVL